MIELERAHSQKEQVEHNKAKLGVKTQGTKAKGEGLEDHGEELLKNGKCRKMQDLTGVGELRPAQNWA